MGRRAVFELEGHGWFSLVKDEQQIQLVTFHQLLKLLTSFLSFTLLFSPSLIFSTFFHFLFFLSIFFIMFPSLVCGLTIFTLYLLPPSLLVPLPAI